MPLTILLGSIVGLSLGLTGGGGSIFAVPLLVYGLRIDFRSAVGISLAVVGLTAFYGAFLQARRGQVLWRAGLLLGVGGIVASPAGAALGNILSEGASLTAFSVLMLVIGIRMLGISASGSRTTSRFACSRGPEAETIFGRSCVAKLLAAGVATGLLAGVFGVGGGFLIVPAVLATTSISIERAMGTSLVSISLISASGFASNLASLSPSHLGQGAIFLGGSWIGMTLGSHLKSKLPGDALGRVFAAMVIATALYVLFRTFAG